MERTVRILIQTTTPVQPNDWSIDSFGLLREHLGSLREGGSHFEVTARNRESGSGGDDPVLAARLLLDVSGRYIDIGDFRNAADVSMEAETIGHRFDDPDIPDVARFQMTVDVLCRAIF